MTIKKTYQINPIYLKMRQGGYTWEQAKKNDIIVSDKIQMDTEYFYKNFIPRSEVEKAKYQINLALNKWIDGKADYLSVKIRIMGLLDKLLKEKKP